MSHSIPTLGAWGQRDRCGFKPVPATMRMRIMVMGKEKPPQPQSRVIGLAGLQRRGWGEQAPGCPGGVTVPLQPPHSPCLPWGGSLGSPSPVRTGGPRARSGGLGVQGGGCWDRRTQGKRVPPARQHTKPLHRAPPSAGSLHPGPGRDPCFALRGYRGLLRGLGWGCHPGREGRMGLGRGGGGMGAVVGCSAPGKVLLPAAGTSAPSCCAALCVASAATRLSRVCAPGRGG